MALVQQYNFPRQLHRSELQWTSTQISEGELKMNRGWLTINCHSMLLEYTRALKQVATGTSTCRRQLTLKTGT